MSVEVASTNLTFYPGRRTGGALLLIAALSAGLSIFVLKMAPGPEEPAWTGVSIGVCLLILAIGIATYAANDLRRSITLTDEGIYDRDFRGTRFIPYDGITGVHLIRHSNQQWSERVVRIEGAGRRISFSSATQGYAPLLETILRRSVNARLEDVNDRPEAEDARRRWEARRRKFTLIAVGIPVAMGALLAGRSAYMLQLESRLDSEGKTVPGLVIHGERTAVEYRFQAGNRVVVARSPTVEHEYEQAAPGDRIDVVYLPEDPTVCRIQGGVGRRPWYTFLAMGLMTFVLIPILIQKPR